MVSVCGPEKRQQEGHFEEGADGDNLYRLLEHDPHSALNAGQTAACAPLKGMVPGLHSTVCCCWLGVVNVIAQQNAPY